MQSKVDVPGSYETHRTLSSHSYVNIMAVMATLIFSRQVPHCLNHDLVSAK